MSGINDPPTSSPPNVIRQDSQPTDTRDGVVWVKTSEPNRPVFVYSNDTGGWEPAAPGVWTAQDTEPTSPSVGDGWIDTSQDPPVKKVYDGISWLSSVTSVDGQRGDVITDRRAYHYLREGESVDHSANPVHISNGRLRVRSTANNNDFTGSVTATFVDGTTKSISQYTAENNTVTTGISSWAFGYDGLIKQIDVSDPNDVDMEVHVKYNTV